MFKDSEPITVLSMSKITFWWIRLKVLGFTLDQLKACMTLSLTGSPLGPADPSRPGSPRGPGSPYNVQRSFF